MSALATILSYGAKVNVPADEFLKQVSPDLSRMLRYFMGFTDETGNAADGSGKRFRPAFMLYIAEALGVLEETIPAALSVELYHNFTLIHDDVEDNDELRRGRPTVWKVWGVNSAINAGDAQLILALQALAPLRNQALQDLLLARYLEVVEGQQLDFALADAPLIHEDVNESAYMELIGKKSAALVAASTAAPGYIAGLPQEECTLLEEFGREFGIAYQLFDDKQSLWGGEIRTGKGSHGDIRERKKTFPLLHARDTLSNADKVELVGHYAVTPDDESVAAVLALIEKSGAREVTERKIESHVANALSALSQTSIPKEYQERIREAIHELVG